MLRWQLRYFIARLDIMGLSEANLDKTFSILSAQSILSEFDIDNLFALNAQVTWDLTYELNDFANDVVNFRVISNPANSN
jgi:hypothetical protein